MVTSGKNYNGGCCFDYGNAETNNLDTGKVHMEAIYFGRCTSWGSASKAACDRNHNDLTRGLRRTGGGPHERGQNTDQPS